MQGHKLGSTSRRVIERVMREMDERERGREGASESEEVTSTSKIVGASASRGLRTYPPSSSRPYRATPHAPLVQFTYTRPPLLVTAAAKIQDTLDPHARSCSHPRAHPRGHNRAFAPNHQNDRYIRMCTSNMTTSRCPRSTVSRAATFTRFDIHTNTHTRKTIIRSVQSGKMTGSCDQRAMEEKTAHRPALQGRAPDAAVRVHRFVIAETEHRWLHGQRSVCRECALVAARVVRGVDDIQSLPGTQSGVPRSLPGYARHSLPPVCFLPVSWY